MQQFDIQRGGWSGGSGGCALTTTTPGFRAPGGGWGGGPAAAKAPSPSPIRFLEIRWGGCPG